MLTCKERERAMRTLLRMRRQVPEDIELDRKLKYAINSLAAQPYWYEKGNFFCRGHLPNGQYTSTDETEAKLMLALYYMSEHDKTPFVEVKKPTREEILAREEEKARLNEKAAFGLKTLMIQLLGDFNFPLEEWEWLDKKISRAHAAIESRYETLREVRSCLVP